MFIVYIYIQCDRNSGDVNTATIFHLAFFFFFPVVVAATLSKSVMKAGVCFCDGP